MTSLSITTYFLIPLISLILSWSNIYEFLSKGSWTISHFLWSINLITMLLVMWTFAILSKGIKFILTIVILLFVSSTFSMFIYVVDVNCLSARTSNYSFYFNFRLMRVLVSLWRSQCFECQVTVFTCELMFVCFNPNRGWYILLCFYYYLYVLYLIIDLLYNLWQGISSNVMINNKQA